MTNKVSLQEGGWIVKKILFDIYSVKWLPGKTPSALIIS